MHAKQQGLCLRGREGSVGAGTLGAALRSAVARPAGPGSEMPPGCDGRGEEAEQERRLSRRGGWAGEEAEQERRLGRGAGSTDCASGQGGWDSCLLRGKNRRDVGRHRG